MKTPSKEKSLGGLLEIYAVESKKQLSKYEMNNDISTTTFKGLTLKEYVKARKAFCEMHHANVKCKCLGFIEVAMRITAYGYVKLKTAFVCITQHKQLCNSCMHIMENKDGQQTLPELVERPVDYTPAHAKRLLLQMPVAALRIDGLGTILCDAQANTTMLKSLLERQKKQCSQNNLTKDCFKELIALCSSDTDRDCLKYAVAKASGASGKEMRMRYGVENFNTKAKQVEEASRHVQMLKEGIEYLASVKEEAVMSSLGFPSLPSSESEDSMSSEEESDPEQLKNNERDQVNKTNHPRSFISSANKNASEEIFKQPDKLKDLLERNHFNWVALSGMVEEEIPGIVVADALSNILSMLPSLELSSKQLNLIEQSQQVFKQMEEVNKENSKIEDGFIVSDEDDSFSHEPIDWNTIKDPCSEKAKEIVVKRIKSIRRKKKRDLKRKIAEQRILKRKRSKKVGRILTKYPNIGKDIEQFVSEAGVGADAWRRTGVLTFDGNRKVKKVTFCSIKKHLEEKYATTFSYGSIVQLSVARNKRRINARNYKGVAKITCRRSRKTVIGLLHFTKVLTTSNTRNVAAR